MGRDQLTTFGGMASGHNRDWRVNPRVRRSQQGILRQGDYATPNPPKTSKKHTTDDLVSSVCDRTLRKQGTLFELRTVCKTVAWPQS